MTRHPIDEAINIALTLHDILQVNSFVLTPPVTQESKTALPSHSTTTPIRLSCSTKDGLHICFYLDDLTGYDDHPLAGQEHASVTAHASSHAPNHLLRRFTPTRNNLIGWMSSIRLPVHPQWTTSCATALAQTLIDLPLFQQVNPHVYLSTPLGKPNEDGQHQRFKVFEDRRTTHKPWTYALLSHDKRSLSNTFQDYASPQEAFMGAAKYIVFGGDSLWPSCHKDTGGQLLLAHILWPNEDIKSPSGQTYPGATIWMRDGTSFRTPTVHALKHLFQTFRPSR